MALAAYRNVLRAARLAFKGDERVLDAACFQARESFRKNAHLSPSDPAYEEAIRHAEEIAQFLKQNVVQGRKEGELYKLRIHSETERGDNDTIKLAGGKTIKIDGKTCKDL